MNNNPKYELKPAGEKDISLISEMARKIWPIHYTPIIGEEQVRYMLGNGYSGEGLLRSMKEGERFFLCICDNVINGYLSVSDKGDDGIFMNKFYLLTEEQGKGRGKIFFDLLLNKLSQPPVIRLQVNRMNIKTINFYFRVGFRIEYAKNFDIGNGFSMDDFVMIRRESAAEK